MGFLVRYKLAIAGFWTTFGALLTRNALTMAIVEISSAGHKSNELMINGSCPSSSDQREFKVTNGTENAAFEWTNKQHGLMLGSFFFGYSVAFPFVQRVLQKLGPRKTVTGILVMSACLSLLYPLLISIPRIGYFLGLIVRIIMGISQGFQIPAFFNLWANWAPAQEKTRLVISESLGMPAGAATIVYIGGLLMTWADWRYVFWFAGVVTGLIAIIWHVIARDTPEEHPWLDDKEREFIMANRLVKSTKIPRTVPYRKMLTSGPVLAWMVAYMTLQWYFNTSFIQMPRFLTQVQGFTIKKTGRILALSHLAGPFLQFGACYLVDFCVIRGVRVRTSQRAVQAFGGLIPGFIEQLWFVVGCDHKMTILIVFSSILSAIQTAKGPNILDICPRYAAQVQAVGGSIALMWASLSPVYASFFTRYAWKYQIYLELNLWLIRRFYDSWNNSVLSIL